MPIYEYQCKACGHQLEAIQSFADKPLRKCPACHKAGLNKLISAPSFHLKGTGWYATDFKNSGKKPVAAESSDKAAAGGSDTKDTKAASGAAEKSAEKKVSAAKTDTTK